MATGKKRERPGEDFEAQFLASVPRGVYRRKLRTPTPPAYEAPRLVSLVEELCQRLREPAPDWVKSALRWVRFTSKAGYDILLAVPAPFSAGAIDLQDHLGRSAPLKVQPVITFALELKSVDGISLPFSNVEPNQEKALREAADEGLLAGFVIEFRKAGEVWFVPIGAWTEIRAVTDRASLPLEAARRVGMEILPDPYRGTSRAYWNVTEWLVRCGGLIPDRPKKKRGQKDAPAPKARPSTTAGPVVRGLFD